MHIIRIDFVFHRKNNYTATRWYAVTCDVWRLLTIVFELTIFVELINETSRVKTFFKYLTAIVFWTHEKSRPKAQFYSIPQHKPLCVRALGRYLNIRFILLKFYIKYIYIKYTNFILNRRFKFHQNFHQIFKIFLLILGVHYFLLKKHTTIWFKILSNSITCCTLNWVMCVRYEC